MKVKIIKVEKLSSKCVFLLFTSLRNYIISVGSSHFLSLPECKNKTITGLSEKVA